MKNNDTYVKLYRKILDNKKLWKDHNAVRVLIWLLLRADYKTGKIETGRFVAAEDIDINPNTFYATLKRLEKQKIITQVSNNKYTSISILNWSRYQGNDNTKDNNKITTRQQQDNTIQEVNNINNKRNNNKLYSVTEYDKEAAKRELAGLPKFRAGELERVI